MTHELRKKSPWYILSHPDFSCIFWSWVFCNVDIRVIHQISFLWAKIFLLKKKKIIIIFQQSLELTDLWEKLLKLVSHGYVFSSIHLCYLKTRTLVFVRSPTFSTLTSHILFHIGRFRHFFFSIPFFLPTSPSTFAIRNNVWIFYTNLSFTLCFFLSTSIFLSYYKNPWPRPCF
jgi:hypothetical protein